MDLQAWVVNVGRIQGKGCVGMQPFLTSCLSYAVEGAADSFSLSAALPSEESRGMVLCWPKQPNLASVIYSARKSLEIIQIWANFGGFVEFQLGVWNRLSGFFFRQNFSWRPNFAAFATWYHEMWIFAESTTAGEENGFAVSITSFAWQYTPHQLGYS